MTTTALTIVPTDTSEHDAIAKVVQHYINGAKSGRGDDMKPAFHEDATLFGYAGEDLFGGPIELMFEWNDNNGPATELKPDNWEYYLSERGAFGRVNAAYEADLHLGYPLQLGDHGTVNFLLDIFNLLDVQKETLRSLRYTTADDSPYQPIDWLTAEIFTISPGDTANPPTNPAFNTPTAWTSPRAIRLGLRYTFN